MYAYANNNPMTNVDPNGQGAVRNALVRMKNAIHEVAQAVVEALVEVAQNIVETIVERVIEKAPNLMPEASIMADAGVNGLLTNGLFPETRLVFGVVGDVLGFFFGWVHIGKKTTTYTDGGVTYTLSTWTGVNLRTIIELKSDNTKDYYQIEDRRRSSGVIRLIFYEWSILRYRKTITDFPADLEGEILPSGYSAQTIEWDYPATWEHLTVSKKYGFIWGTDRASSGNVQYLRVAANAGSEKYEIIYDSSRPSVTPIGATGQKACTDFIKTLTDINGKIISAALPLGTATTVLALLAVLVLDPTGVGKTVSFTALVAIAGIHFSLEGTTIAILASAIALFPTLESQYTLAKAYGTKVQ